MPPLGAHLSIAGGHHNALLRAQELGCEVVQMFTKSCAQWRAKPLSKSALALFHDTRSRTDVPHLLGHASYLINLASPKPMLRERSVRALASELRRARRLGLECLIVHPGSHRGDGVRRGLQSVVQSLARVCRRVGDPSPKIVLETMSGQGHTLGSRFEHLAWVLEHAGAPERLGVCLDTCHAFAAGYDLRTERSCNRVLAELDRIVGFGHVDAIHLNDSQHGLGSRLDRHEHIGRGKIGLAGFRAILNAQPCQIIPMCLETPKGQGNSGKLDKRNLRVLRSLVR